MMFRLASFSVLLAQREGESENIKKVKIRFILFAQLQDALMLPDGIKSECPDGFLGAWEQARSRTVSKTHCNWMEH